jgi:hypothetical protein
MIDAFVLLTPILLLAILALLGFVGCNQVFGLNETIPAIDLNTIMPSSGPVQGGTPVTITGAQLTGVTAVNFGAAPAVLRSDVMNSDVVLNVYTSMSKSAGVVDVTVIKTDSHGNPTYTATKPNAYTYIQLNFVQSNGTSQATSPPLSVSLNNTTQGNLLIAAVQFGGTPSPSVSVSDNLGHTFTLAGSATWLRHAQIFYLPNIPGGNVTSPQWE